MLFEFVVMGLARRPRTWIIALLAAAVTGLLLLSLATINSVYEGTRRSLIESGAGHFQVYNPDSATKPMDMSGQSGQAQLVPIPRFTELARELAQVPGVAHVLAMENGTAEFFRGNYLDERLKAIRAILREPESPARAGRLARLTEDLRRVLASAVENDERRKALFLANTYAEDSAAVARSVSDALWADFERDPLSVLEFLENKVASQLGEGDALRLGYLATDLDRFFRIFPRVQMVSGEKPPPNHRGLLMGHAYYERTFKLPIAFRLDHVKRERARGERIQDSPALRTMLERNLAEVEQFILTLDVERADRLNEALGTLVDDKGPVTARLKSFLTLDDATFEQRYEDFYAKLVPHLPLYRAYPGDVIPLRSQGDNTGVRIRFYGTIRFEGLGSDYDKVNELNLMDPVSAGYLTARTTKAQLEESDAFIARMNIPEIPTDNELMIPAVEEGEVLTGQSQDFVIERAPDPAEAYDAEDALAPGVLQAAIVLAPEADADAVQPLLSARAKAAGHDVGIVTWREVGGLVSDVLFLSRILLGIAGGILFAVLFLVTLGSLVVMSTERVGEVGTLRAIGMHRRQALAAFLLEGSILGAGGGLLGIAAAWTLIAWLGATGIGVTDTSLQVFLGGPVLVPRAELGGALLLLAIVSLLVTLASLWPAVRGSSVEPRVAMARGDL